MESRFDSTRLEAFSDGVFAIAITLLILEISIPASGFHNLRHAVLHAWPSYLAYVTSFLTTGAVWFVHHGIFRRMSHADMFVARLNLFLLMMVSFLPFPTSLLAGASGNGAAERTAVLFYGGVLVVIVLLLTSLCQYVASHRTLLHDPALGDDLEGLVRRITPSLGFFFVVFAVSVFTPRLAAVGSLVIAVLAVFSSRAQDFG